jgi:hypothetical protein
VTETSSWHVTLATLCWLHWGRVAFIYHIAAAADWERAVRDGQYTMSTRGLTLAEQGFIHASTAGQVALVANAFYRDVPDLLLLVIDTERVGPGQIPPISGQDHEEGPSAARRKSSWSRSRFSATVSWDAMCVMPDSGSTVCG